MDSFDNIFNNLLETLHSKVNGIEGEVPLVYIGEEAPKLELEEIISEDVSVFRLKDYEKIVSCAQELKMPKSFKVLGRNALMKLCPKAKRLGPWRKNPGKRLCIIKIDLKSHSELEQVFSFLTGSSNRLRPEIIDVIHSALQKAKGLYVPFSSSIGFIFIGKSFSPGDLVHELIHFFQDVTGQSVAKLDLNESWNPIEVLAKTGHLGAVKMDGIEQLVDESEIIPYFNEVCYALEENNASREEAMDTVNSLIRKKNELALSHGTVKDLMNFLRRKPALRGLGKAAEACLLVCLAYSQHLTLLKRTVGNYFK